MLYVSFVGFVHHNSIIQYYYLYILLFIIHTIDHGGAAVVGKTGWMACLFEYNNIQVKWISKVFLGFIKYDCSENYLNYLYTLYYVNNTRLRYNMENCRYRENGNYFLSRNCARVVYYLFMYLNDEYASITEMTINTQTQNKSKK